MLPLDVTIVEPGSRAGRHTADKDGPPPRLAFSLFTTLFPPTCLSNASNEQIFRYARRCARMHAAD